MPFIICIASPPIEELREIHKRAITEGTITKKLTVSALISFYQLFCLKKKNRNRNLNSSKVSLTFGFVVSQISSHFTRSTQTCPRTLASMSLVSKPRAFHKLWIDSIHVYIFIVSGRRHAEDSRWVRTLVQQLLALLWLDHRQWRHWRCIQQTEGCDREFERWAAVGTGQLGLLNSPKSKRGLNFLAWHYNVVLFVCLFFAKRTLV